MHNVSHCVYEAEVEVEISKSAKTLVITYHTYERHLGRFSNFIGTARPVRRILKRGVQSTTWPLGHSEGEGAGSFYTMDDLECQIFIRIYREKITETIDLSSPSIYINFSLTVDVVFFCWLLQCFGHIQSKNQVAMLEVSIIFKSEKTEQATRMLLYAFIQEDVYIYIQATCIL